jgi:hypothetical protein
MPSITPQSSATGLYSLILEDTMLDGTVDSVLKMTASISCLELNTDPAPVQAAARQGVIGVTGTRPTTFPFVTWDGNPDTGMKMVITNAAANTIARGAVRGLDIQARNKGSVATCSYLNAIYATAENANNTISQMYVGQLNMKNSGVVTDNYGLVIQDQSQGTSTNTYPLRITTGTINPASGARMAAINIASKDTVGFTNLIYAESATLDCAVVGGSMGAVAGYFKVNVNGTDYKIPFNAVA